MSTLDKIKQSWLSQPDCKSKAVQYDQATLEQIIRKRAGKSIGAAMKYFWASFALQLMVFALLTNVIIRFWHDRYTVLLAAAGILLYIPFAGVLMTKFKKMAVASPKGGTTHSLHAYVLQQHKLLSSFFRFKRIYELFLIPLSAAIGVLLVFKLYVPGGPIAHPWGVVITFGLTLFSCAIAIMGENKRNFREPLLQLRQMMEEFNAE